VLLEDEVVTGRIQHGERRAGTTASATSWEEAGEPVNRSR
jgi:hypothetical protein